MQRGGLRGSSRWLKTGWQHQEGNAAASAKFTSGTGSSLGPRLAGDTLCPQLLRMWLHT